MSRPANQAVAQTASRLLRSDTPERAPKVYWFYQLVRDGQRHRTHDCETALFPHIAEDDRDYVRVSLMVPKAGC